jgi:hypothetical protein
VIELLSSPGSRVARVKVSEKLRHEDFGNLRTWVDAAVVSNGRCRVLFGFGDFHGWGWRSFWDDIRFHTTWSDRIERMAYVGNKWWEWLLVTLSAPITRCAVRYYETSENSAAVEWLENQS